MKTIAVIPARYASTRFPGKPLALLEGKPIIQHVWEIAAGSGLFDEVLVATDSIPIYDCVLALGGKAVMTSPDHQSGSDRIAEAIQQSFPRNRESIITPSFPTPIGNPETTSVIPDPDRESINTPSFPTPIGNPETTSVIPDPDRKSINTPLLIVNIQGDEPLIEPDALRELIAVFRDGSVQVASLMTPIINQELLFQPNIVKVVVSANSDAIYFSRSPIPYDRDAMGGFDYYRHIGVYAYRWEALQSFISLPVGDLEAIEKLEQLRYLEHGIPIRMVKTGYQGIGIDSPDDLKMVENILKARKS